MSRVYNINTQAYYSLNIGNGYNMGLIEKEYRSILYSHYFSAALFSSFFTFRPKIVTFYPIIAEGRLGYTPSPAYLINLNILCSYFHKTK